MYQFAKMNSYYTDVKSSTLRIRDCDFCTFFFSHIRMTTNKSTGSSVSANVDEFNQYFARQEKILANRENALMNKEKRFEEKESKISKITSKVSDLICSVILTY